MLWKASDFHGTTIEATDSAIGSVDDFLCSDDNWTIRWAVIDTGNWLPGRQVLLPPDRLTLPNSKSGSIAVPLARTQVEDSPGIDATRRCPAAGDPHLFPLRLGSYWASMGTMRGAGSTDIR